MTTTIDPSDPPARRLFGARGAPVKGVWVAAYCVAAILPLAVVLVGAPPAGRGFVVELASALGIVALTLLALQLALPARLGVVARPLGAEVAIRLHRHMADVLVAAIAAHVALVVVGDPSNLALLDPLGAPWRAQAALASCVALGALIASSVLRRRLGLGYARWRGLHNVLGIAALGLGLLHAVGVDRYLTAGPVGLPAGGLAAVGARRSRGAAVAASAPAGPPPIPGRAGREGARRRDHLGAPRRGPPWPPVPVRPVRLAEAGRLARTRSSSIPSRTRRARPDLSGRASRSRPTAASPAASRGCGPAPPCCSTGRTARTGRGATPRRFVLIAGGIGITPIISLLRTAADTGDRRPYLLVYGSLRWLDITFREELDQLQQRLDLRVVHVLTERPPGWHGEAGFIDADLLARHLPPDLSRADVFVCGPPPMLAAALDGLERLGVAPEHVHAEQFVTV